ncbi:MAG: hypothetical protein HKM01_01950 [Gallionella sp.]|jgi:hypothetical protein|nr:hypothetical protein [Gallionella sp.]NNM79209.1 hypothetical protein [Gallionella sp.]
MMTLILVLACAMIVFIGLLRYDIHKHKYSDAAKAKQVLDDANDKSKTDQA